MLRDILVLVRPQNGLVATLSFALGWLWFAPVGVNLWVGMAIVYLLHSAGTIMNDIVDQETDRLNMANRPLVSGKISLITAQTFYLSFILLALALTMLGGRLFLIWGFIIYLAGWLYNERPFLGSHRPISSIILLILCFTTLPFIFGAQAASGQVFLITAPFVITAIGISFSRGATSLFKDFKDVIGDEATGKETFLLRFGSTITSNTGLLLSVLGGLLILWGTIVARGVGIKMLPAILFIVTGIWLRFRVARGSKKGTETFSSIYTNEIRLQLSHILWIIWPR